MGDGGGVMREVLGGRHFAPICVHLTVFPAVVPEHANEGSDKAPKVDLQTMYA